MDWKEDNTLVFDIGGTNIKYGVMDGKGRLTRFDETPTRAAEGGPAVVERVLALAENCGTFDRVGVSTAGQVDRRTGTVLYATDNIPGYTGMELGKIIARRLGVRVAVENDVNAAALGEAHFGAGREFQNFLCVTFGTGIGGAIVIGRELYTGRRGSAGEFGHFVTHRGGLPCTCGQRGCYEAYASASALERLARGRTGETLDGREIFARLARGDRAMEECVDAWLPEAAAGLAGLIHIFEPEALILGGGIMREDAVLSGLRQRVSALVMPSFRDARLVRAELGNRAGLYGAYDAARRLAQDAREECG